MKIDIYSDVICPWCYLGEKRLEKALELIQPQDPQIRYLPYELMPDTPAEGVDRVQYLKAKYGDAIQGMDIKIAALGQEMGLDYHFEKIAKIPNTLNAHRVVWLAEKEGVQAPVVDAMFEAYFTHGRDVGDSRVLTEIAASVGLAIDQVEALLSGDDGVEEVRALEGQARALGISGVPFFVFEERTAISGAQPVSVFVSLLQQLITAN